MSSKSPQDTFVCPLLTDMYQVSMAYAYWKSDRHELPAVFDLFFRKNPFGGEYCVFAGLDEVLKYLHRYKFLPEHIEYLRSIMPDCEDEFFAYLASIDCSQIRVFAMREGTVSYTVIFIGFFHIYT